MTEDDNHPPDVLARRKKLSRDLNAPIETLLAAMLKDADFTASSNNVELRRTLVDFAILLGRLSIDADKQTRRIVCLTWALAFLTLGLLVVAGVQTRYMKLDEQRKQKAESAEAAKPHNDHSDKDDPVAVKP